MKTKSIVFILGMLLSLASFANPPAETGKLIFSARCAGCHNVNKPLTGPALAGVDQRRSMDWIVNFVHSSQSLIKAGDKTAVELFQQFNKIPMPDHKDLTETDIKSVVEYIKAESAVASAAPFSRPGKLRPNYLPLSINNYGFFITFVVAVLLLAGGLVALVSVKEMGRQRSNRG